MVGEAFSTRAGSLLDAMLFFLPFFKKPNVERLALGCAVVVMGCTSGGVQS